MRAVGVLSVGGRPRRKRAAQLMTASEMEERESAGERGIATKNAEAPRPVLERTRAWSAGMWR